MQKLLKYDYIAVQKVNTSIATNKYHLIKHTLKTKHQHIEHINMHGSNYRLKIKNLFSKTLTFCTGSILSRINKQKTDDLGLGRWSIQHLTLKHKKSLVIITAYLAVRSSN